MLPPLPTNVMTSSPQFATFYSYLTRSLLGPSGTIPPPGHEAKARIKVTEDLHTARIALAKIEISRNGLKDLMSEDMPEELQDLIIILSAPSSNPDTSSLPFSLSDDLPFRHLCDRLSTRLQTLHTSISPLLIPPPSTRIANLAHSRTRLNTSITHLTSTATALLATRRAIAETGIQVLERVRFGAVSRAAVAEAGYWSAMAAGLRAKLEVWHLDAWRKVEREDEGVSRALDNYAGWLRDWRQTLEDREAIARETLADYNSVPGMEGILKAWRGLADERRAVEEMVRRLEEGDDEGGK